MNHILRRCGALALSAAVLAGAVGCGLTGGSKEPVGVTIWHYYNGAQKEAFDRLVSEFNETVGAEKRIVVDSVSQGGVNDVVDRLNESLAGDVGAAALPNAAALYADTAYTVFQQNKAADLSAYLSKDEIAQYVPTYLDEGRFGEENKFYLFPVAKSTEVFMLNTTDWAPFAAATGVSDDAFQTWEGVTRVAQQYYEWTDAQTPDVPNDGKAFFGRDAMANYLLIGSLQLGSQLFSVTDGKAAFQLDPTVMRKLWDNYYVPYVNGWFTANGRFRSDDVKTGDCIALVGSTSGAAYFPTAVTRTDGSNYPIECAVYPVPNFEGAAPYAVQQGASMLVLASDKAHERATVEFLKWFTQTQNGLDFCLGSGYLPVTQEANTESAVTAALEASPEAVPDALRKSLLIGIETVQNATLYTTPAFEHGAAARSVIEASLTDKAKQDREQVLARIAQGTPAKEAVASVATDENFQSWLSDLQAQLQNTAG